MKHEYRYVWKAPPVDFWEHAIIANIDEESDVLAQMPETPRDGTVLKTYVPYDCSMVPLLMCKAENNGDTYFFCDFDIVKHYRQDWSQG